MMIKYGKKCRVFQLLACAILTVPATSYAQPQAKTGSSISKAVERMICQNLANKAIGERANYKSGVRVSGEEVTPAEGPQAGRDVREVVTVPLTIDLARRMGVNVPDSIEMKAQLGILHIDREGAIRFDNKDITDKARQLCNSAEGGQQKGPELPLPGTQKANQPPENLNRPESPDKTASPNSPDEPSMPTDPDASNDAGVKIPVHDPEMHRNGDAAPEIQAPGNGDDAPRAFKFSPDKDAQSR